MFRIRDGLLLGTTVVIDANGNLTTNAATATTAGRLTAARNIDLTGAVTGTVSTDFSGTTSITTTMSATAVTPGTYRSVTVTQDGRIVSGSNPTTLAGYSITDALNLSGGTMTGALVLSGDPTLPLHPATKQYVDNASAGIDVKDSARVATTANITLSGTQTIDGVAVVAGNRVLVKNQTTASQNGIYVVAAGAWSRATDMDVWSELAGSFIFVSEGTANANSGWVCAAASGGTIDTTAISFNQFAGAGTYTTSNGLTLSGNDFRLTGQALAFHNLASDGLVVRSGNSVTAREIVGSTGLTVTNSTGVSGNPTLTLATKLSNLSAMNSTAGLLIQTGADSFTKRTLAQTTGVTITNADGVSGNPTIGLSTSLANFAGVTWDSGVVIPVLTASNTWAIRHTGVGSTDLVTGALGDARYAALAGSTLIGNLTLVGGSTTVAPLRFQDGVVLTTPIAHSLEWDGTNLFITTSAGTRQTVQYSSDALAWSRVSGTPTTLSGYGITDAVASSAYTASDVLSKLLTVDGPGSGLNADLLDGQTGSYYLDATNLTGTIADARLSANVPLKNAVNTFSAGQIVNTGAATASLRLDAAASQYKWLEFSTAGTRRWLVYTNNDAETGSNAGSTFIIGAYNDAGAFSAEALRIARSTGIVQFASTPTVTGSTIWHAGNDGTGTGLDADLLDGQQGTFYQNSGNQNAGTLPAARLPAFTGDVTTSAGASVTTLATVNSNVGSFGSATQAATFTVNAKGLVTAAGAVTVTPAWGSITSKPTTLTGYGITDAQGLDATLTSLAALTGAGVVTATGTDTFIMRSIGAASANDIPDRTAADARYLQPATANAINDARFVQLGGSTMTGALVLSGDPTLPLHPATKQYVDNAIQGLDAKASVRVSTTANITLSGTQTIDGIAVIVGDRVLVKNQTTGSQNGVYIVAAGSWTRALDFSAWNEVVKSFVFVEEGAAAANTGWVNTNSASGTLDTTAVTFVQFSGAGAYTASNGLTRSGLDFQLTGQALAVHNLASSGIISRTGSGTVAARSITQPAAGITVSNGDGVAGNPTLALANDLAAVESLATTGFVRRTGTDAWTATALSGSEVTTALGYTPWHADNDGTGSTLDSDLLDGQHGAYYLDLGNVTGTLATNRGGTGMASFTANSYVRATSTSTLDNRTFEQVRADIMAARTIEDTAPPSSPSIGDGWIDSNSGTKYNYVSGFWVEL